MMDDRINRVRVRVPSDRNSFLEAAFSSDESCVSVGGLGIQSPAKSPPPNGSGRSQAISRLVDHWRRSQKLEVEEFAARTGLDVSEILEVLLGDKAPGPQVIRALSSLLGVSYEKLLYIAGHAAEEDEVLSRAAERFVTHSAGPAQLSPEEERALHEFIKVLAE